MKKTLLRGRGIGTEEEGEKTGADMGNLSHLTTVITGEVVGVVGSGTGMVEEGMKEARRKREAMDRHFR